MLLAHVQATRDESEEVTSSNPDTAGRTEISFLGLSPSVPIIQVIIPFLVQTSGSNYSIVMVGLFNKILKLINDDLALIVGPGLGLEQK